MKPNHKPGLPTSARGTYERLELSVTVRKSHWSWNEEEARKSRKEGKLEKGARKPGKAPRKALSRAARKRERREAVKAFTELLRGFQ